MTSRQALLVTLAVLAAAGMGFSASTVLGENTSNVRPESPARHAAVSTEVVSAKAVKGLKVVYLSFRKTVQPGKEDGGQVKCPKSAPHGVAGIFGPSANGQFGDVVLSNSNPQSDSGRVWDIGVRSLGQQPQEYIAGAVCIG